MAEIARKGQYAIQGPQFHLSADPLNPAVAALACHQPQEMSGSGLKVSAIKPPLSDSRPSIKLAET